METYNGVRGIFAFIKGYYDDVGTIFSILISVQVRVYFMLRKILTR